MKITIDVERLDRGELHFKEQIGEGTYGDVEFKVFCTVPQHSLEIWVEDERHLISSGELIKATLQAVLEDQRKMTVVLNERDEIVDIEGYGKEDQIQAAEALRDELQRYIERLAWDAANGSRKNE